MKLQLIDWTIIGAFFIISLLIGIMVSKQEGKNTSEFFLSGRSMPWWLLGVSIVATTFSADTPNLFADIVRNNGISGNWIWWAFLLAGVLTVFLYAKLWRRSKVLTDLEFYELRYSGKEVAFLRGFRALYLGFFFNIVIMASVSLAAIKIGGVLMGLTPVQTMLIASVITVIYSSLGGLKGVISHDKFTRLLSKGNFDSKTLWQQSKVTAQEISQSKFVKVLSFDDSIMPKPHTKENALNCWHYDHCSGRSVKGVQFLTALFNTRGMNVPVMVELINHNNI